MTFGIASPQILQTEDKQKIWCPLMQSAPGGRRFFFFFFFTLITGPRRSVGLELSDTRVYEPQLRAGGRRNSRLPWSCGGQCRAIASRPSFFHYFPASNSFVQRSILRVEHEGFANQVISHPQTGAARACSGAGAAGVAALRQGLRGGLRHSPPARLPRRGSSSLLSLQVPEGP